MGSEECRVFLIGGRASGKSTVGRALAARLGWDFADTDAIVTRRAGCDIATLVAERGWDAFRDMESDALRDAAARERVVVATGGGMVLRAENRALLREAGVTVFLSLPVEVVAARLARNPEHGQRPSLTGKAVADEVADVMRERAPLYAEAARHVVRGDAPVACIVEDITALLAFS